MSMVSRSAVRLFPVEMLLFCLACGPLGAAEEKLIPANNNPAIDSLGMKWDVQRDGQVNDGTNDCFDSGEVLQIAGGNFQPQAFMKTADNAEWVISGAQQNNVAITRRIRVLSRNALRYAEVLVNKGATKEQLTLTLTSNLGNTAQTTVWSDGRPQGGLALPKGCVGIAAIQQPQRPTVIWIVGEGRSASPPQVTIQQNRTYQVTWAVSLAPKQTRVIYHYVLQRPGMLAPQVADAVKPFWKGSLVKTELAPALMRQVVNFRVQGAADGAEADEDLTRLPAIAQLLERAGVDDDGAMDLVGVGRSEAERMRGKLSGGPLVVTTPQGSVTVTVDELAGGEGGDPTAILHLRSGESLAATRIAGSLALDSEAGVSLPVDPVHMLWLATRPRRADMTPPAGLVGILEEVDGTRLGLTGLAAPLALTCVWGHVELPLARIAHIARVIEPTPAWLVTCDDGSILRAVPETSELQVLTRRFGAIPVAVGTLISYRQAGAKPPADDPPDDGAQLANGDRLAGGLAGATLVLRAGGKDSAVPSERIAAIERPEDGPGLALVLKDGSRLVGLPADGTVGFLAGGCTIRVPAERILAWKVKAPPEPEAKPEPEPAAPAETPPAPGEPPSHAQPPRAAPAAGTPAAAGPAFPSDAGAAATGPAGNAFPAVDAAPAAGEEVPVKGEEAGAAEKVEESK